MNQLTLPYEEITKIANRDYLRANFDRGAKEIYRIPIEKIQERQGFNKRIIYDGIEELADSIASNELEVPLTVDVLPCGTVYLEKGYRRYRAIMFNKNRGIKMPLVDCYINSREKTEQKRMEDIYNSNMNVAKLKPVEAAAVVFDLKNNFGKVSNEEIGKRLGISRQQVDNLLLLAEADDATKQEMLNGDLGIVEAIAYLRNQKKAKKQSEKTEEDSHKTSLSPTPEPKDALSTDLKELAELEKETPDEKELRMLKEQAAQEKAFEALLEISDEIKVNKLNKHFGKKLSADVKKIWQEDFVDEDNGEVVERTEMAYVKGTVIDEEVFNGIIAIPGVKTVFVYKEGCEPVAASVITEPVAEKEKDKYDKDRPEIAQIQNVIKLLDKIEAVVNKIDCPEQTKLDLAKYVQWAQKDAAEAREWIHKNKKQNKR